MKGYPIKQFIYLIFLIFSLFVSMAKAQGSIGQVVWVKGPVKATLPGEAPRALNRRSPIYEKDTLTTDATSTGQVVFSDNSLLALRENTSIVLEKYSYTKGAPAKETFAASLAKGGFRTITGAIATDNPDGYSTKTPVATIGVRGTQYSIFYSPGKAGMAAKLQQGEIVISNAHGSVTLKKCAKKELSDKKKPCIDQLYARVASANEAPQAVSQQPEEFNNDVEIITVSASGGGSGTSGGPPGKGPVDSFSINLPCPE